MIKLSSFKKSLIFSLSVFMLSFILTGCNGASDTQKNDGSNSSNRANDTLTVTQTNDIKSLDPALAEDNYTNNVASNIYQSLLCRKLKDGKYEIVGNLAKSWEISSDGKSYTFELRENVKFHDDTEFNAEVVKLNIDRQINALEKKDGRFEYATIAYSKVENVEIVDKFTVKINLKEPQTSFLGILSMDIGVGFASKKALTDRANDPQGVDKQPIGTGPYKFVSREKDQYVRLARFDNYWEEKAKTKNLVFKIISDPQTQITALKNGEVDIIKDCNFTSEAQIKNDGNVIKKDPYNCTSYMFFNHKNDVFKNKEVRKAIAQAIDVPLLNKSLYKDYADPANSFLPKVIDGYDENLKGIEYNLEAAKETLKKFGVKKIKIATYSNNKPYNPVGGTALAEYVKGCIDKLGIEIEVVVDSRAWVQFQDLVKSKKEYDVAFCGWSADFSDPSNFMQIITTGSGMNYGYYSNQEYDDLFQASDKIPLGVERSSNYTKLEKIALEDVAWLPLSHMYVLNATRPSIKGLQQPPAGTIPFYMISKQ